MGDDAGETRAELEHDFLDNAKSFNWAAVKTMLGDNPDLVNVQPAGRWTALHQAAYEGNGDITTYLLDQGANPAALTRSGELPLQVAKKGAVEVLKRRGPQAEDEDDNVDEDTGDQAETEVEEPKKKKAKKAKKVPVYALNINNAVDKEYEDCSLHEIAAAPTSALQGIAEKGKQVFKKLGIKTIRDLGTWRFYKIAKAISGLAALEEDDKRPAASAMNINKALVKKHEVKSLSEIVNLPPSALEGLAGWADAELASLHVKTIGALGGWKFAQWSEWIVDLAEFESRDFSS